MDLLKAFKVILHPLQVARTYLSAEYNVSVSALLPVLFGLVKFLEPVELTSQVSAKLNVKYLMKLKEDGNYRD